MKRSKVIGTFILCVVLSLSVIYSAVAISGVRTAGEQRKKLEHLGDVVVFSINGENVKQKDFDTYQTLMKEANNLLTTEEIKDKYIRQRIIFQEAERRGYSASEEEVNDLTNSRFDALKQDSEAYQIVKDYVDGLGITMEEYIEQSNIISEQALISTKMKNDIEDEFLNSNLVRTTLSENDKKDMAEKYYNDYIDSLVQNADIN